MGSEATAALREVIAVALADAWATNAGRHSKWFAENIRGTAFVGELADAVLALGATSDVMASHRQPDGVMSPQRREFVLEIRVPAAGTATAGSTR